MGGSVLKFTNALQLVVDFLTKKITKIDTVDEVRTPLIKIINIYLKTIYFRIYHKLTK